MKPNHADDFWKRVRMGSPAECWPWLGCRLSTGYGQVSFQGRRVGTHRLAYALAVGHIPPGAVVRHTCDNRLCCNPAHLRSGSVADNSRDMVERGRSLVGERHHNAKLTDEQVCEIRRRYEAGGVSHSRLAGEYRVSKRVIGNIVRRESWGHL